MNEGTYTRIEAKGIYKKVEWQELCDWFHEMYDPLSLRTFRGSATPSVTDRYDRTHWSRGKDKKGFGELIILNADENWDNFKLRFYDKDDDKNRFIDLRINCQEMSFVFCASLDNHEKLLAAYKEIIDKFVCESDINFLEYRQKEEKKEKEQKFGILYSPRQAENDFTEWASACEEDQLGIAILYLDLDNLKRLNTKYNETLVDKDIFPKVMNLLKITAYLRGGAYRQGGDEFIIVLPNHDLEEAFTFGEKVRKIFTDELFEILDKKERITVSIGIALWPGDGSTYEDVLQIANERKKQAKKTKNKCVEH